MDMRYLRYVSPKEYYYVPPYTKIQESALKTPEGLGDWENETDAANHWRYFYKKGMQIPKQGWKIHITANMDEAQNALNRVVPILIKYEVPFKFVSNFWELMLKNSKYGDRGSSGKFITIYPKTEEQFILLLQALHEALSELKKGPYILSDKRWKDGNVYFRYGGFVEMYMWDGATKKLAIQKPDGTFVPDAREPYYILPDFVKEPKEIVQMEQERAGEETQPSPLDQYEMSSALHYSNGGGVYLAKDIETEKSVVIKEGRPGAGLDGRSHDAVSRIRHEAEMLKKLSGAKYVVGFHQLFQAWEHTFLVEDYVEGTALNTWIAAFYPFSETQNIETYTEKAVKIMEQLKEAVEEIHDRGIGMGDLQPANVIVCEDESICLIDFENASDLQDKRQPGLMTPGFVSLETQTREQADWFALVRIARYLFLPIGPVVDLDAMLVKKHDEWIEKKFGKKVALIINELEQVCQEKMGTEAETLFHSDSAWYVRTDVKNLVQKMRKGIAGSIKNEERLLGGDIRQYEKVGGMQNVLTGGFGVIMALVRTGELTETARQWMQEYSKEIYTQKLDDGLFTGKAGIAGVLLECGETQRAVRLMDQVKIKEDGTDISLLSGLAGIGLAFLGFYHKFYQKSYLQRSISAGEKLAKLLEADITVKPYDMDFIPMGLLDGWSGAALFFCALYRCSGEERWKELAVRAVKKDLEKCVFTDEHTLQLKDASRFVPYLAGGSSGVGIALLEVRDVMQTDKWDRELIAIGSMAKSKCYYSSGLFRGATGILVYANALESSCIGTGGYVDAGIELMNLYLLEKQDAVYVPGDYSYKISGDVFSGSSGALLALNDINQGKWLSWLPVACISDFTYLIGSNNGKQRPNGKGGKA